jgi:hypothetical protein
MITRLVPILLYCICYRNDSASSVLGDVECYVIIRNLVQGRHGNLTVSKLVWLVQSSGFLAGLSYTYFRSEYGYGASKYAYK